MKINVAFHLSLLLYFMIVPKTEGCSIGKRFCGRDFSGDAFFYISL